MAPVGEAMGVIGGDGRDRMGMIGHEDAAVLFPGLDEDRTPTRSLFGSALLKVELNERDVGGGADFDVAGVAGVGGDGVAEALDE